MVADGQQINNFASPWIVVPTLEYTFPIATGHDGYVRLDDTYHSKNPGPYQPTTNTSSPTYNPYFLPNPGYNQLNMHVGHDLERLGCLGVRAQCWQQPSDALQQRAQHIYLLRRDIHPSATHYRCDGDVSLVSYVDANAPDNRTLLRSTGVYAFVLVVSLFFLWGVANNLNDILIKQFKKAFELSDFRAGLVQSAFYVGYFLLAIPASLVTRHYGYKATLLAGLGLYALGAFAFYPAAALHTYPLFLGALFVIASGLAFLETAANPLVTVLGPAQGATRRLNLAQSFNPLGSIAGILIGRYFIFSGVEWSLRSSPA